MTVNSPNRMTPLSASESSMLGGYTLPAVFGAAVDARGDAVAVIDRDQSWSWRRWRDEADAVACGLQELGVRPGDVVAVQLPNCMDFLTLHVAIAMVGAVLLPVHPSCGAAELKALAQRTEPAVLVVPRHWRGVEGTAAGPAVQAATPALRHVLVGGDGEAVAGSVAALVLRCAGGVPRPVDVRPDWPLVLVASSGTTSARPKICLHTHDGLLSNAAHVVADGGAGEHSDTMLSASSFTFLFGMLSAHICMLTQAPQVLLERWDVGVFLDVATRHRPTVLFAVPAQLHDVVERIGPAGGSRPPGRLREVRTGGAAVPPDLVLDIIRALADGVIVQWGMSEVGAGTFTRPGDPVELSSRTIGRPISGAKVRIIAADGQVCADGETGELQYRSPYLFRGYFRDDELTDLAVTADGWLRTGDLASVDGDGLIRFRGRATETINVGGRKVSALEIEALLSDLRPLADAAVVAHPDPRLGEILCLVCTVKDGSTLSLHDVTAHLASKDVARYKMPAKLVVVDRLPYTPNGKIARRRVMTLAADRATLPAQPSPGSPPPP